MLACFAFAEIELGMLTALPVHQKPKRRRLDIDNDLFNNRADDPLLEIERRGVVTPQGRQIPGELTQVLFFLVGKGARRWIKLGQCLLQSSGSLQRLVPAALQGSRHKTVFRLDRIILTLATAGLETGALKLQLKLAPFLRSRFGQLVRRLSKGLHPNRRQRRQHGVHNRLLNLETAA